MAAAWLKLDVYGTAEHCAQCALAHYRCGLACKGSLQLYVATLDFEVILEQDPDSIKAKKVLQETINLMNRRTESEGSVVIDETFPSLDEPKLKLESMSDSSDWNHKGSGTVAKTGGAVIERVCYITAGTFSRLGLGILRMLKG
ncbi:hypothetical protein EI94DRAFT_1705714 [Lactarius quietus]|nr:hypothetical protein EI94DRAFT_1705714 [Lactarius quietus]